MSYQKCPICNGTGQDLTVSITNGLYKCPTCKGHRIINEQTGLPPTVPDKDTSDKKLDTDNPQKVDSSQWPNYTWGQKDYIVKPPQADGPIEVPQNLDELQKAIEEAKLWLERK